jgi:hypothetical protein
MNDMSTSGVGNGATRSTTDHYGSGPTIGTAPDASVNRAGIDLSPGITRQTVDQWINGLPNNASALGAIDRWAGSASIPALVAQTEADLRTTIAGPETLGGATLIDQIQREADDIKVGYALGAVAANIEARLEAMPAASRGPAADYADALRLRGDSLSFGAARDASPLPGVYAYGGQCYGSANALAAAVRHDRNNPTGPVMSEWTPQMQEKGQIAAMDREIWNRGAGLGFSMAETSYMYARGSGATAAELRQAYARGQLVDIALDLGDISASVMDSRNGLNVQHGPDW